MNYILFFIPFLVVSNLCSAKKIQAPLYNVQLTGMIEASNGLDRVNEHVIHFMGKETRNDSKGLFSLFFESSQFHPSMPSILITKKESIEFDTKNTPLMINPHPDKKYRYFVPTPDARWKEEALESSSIPLNCVIILMDPNFVDELVPWETEFEYKIQIPMVKLPRIVLKKDIPERKQENATIKSLNYSRDTAKIYQQALPQRQEMVNPRGGRTEIIIPQ